jgi:Iap family predicted aminopeptidase
MYLFLLLVSGAALSAQVVRFQAVDRNVVETRLNSYVRKNDAREPALRRLFESAGCGNITEPKVGGVKYPNLVCTMPGETSSVIVVGAHYDLEEAGAGVVDNWSGASLLPSLFEGLKSVSRKHTFVFVGFSGEEKGMLGSRSYVRDWKKTREPIQAMVNLDTLGLAESEVWVSRADKSLVDLMSMAAATIQLPVSAVNVEQVGSTDSESFRAEKIPAITIHSLTNETLSILHSNKDTIDAIKMDEYYRTYRLVLVYLALLDEKLN